MSTSSASSLRAGHAERLQRMQATATDLRARGLIHQTAEDRNFDGRTLRLDGQRLINFASCSYLGLETDERLKRAACEAVANYGVHFYASRAYVSAPPYRIYEQLLSEMVGGSPVVVTQTTTLGHMAALPVLVGERDAVLFDLQVHNSVQAVLPTLKAIGAHCEVAAHARLDRVASRARALARKHERIFYLCDGVYSMHGDVVDTSGLFALLDDNPQLLAYVDDSHGVGWAGTHGAGVVIGQRAIHPQMVVALGLAKGFAGGGAAFVFPNPDLAQRVFSCGSTLIFSGPLQPALLGAGIAAARFCLSEELAPRQAQLLRAITAFDEIAKNGDVLRQVSPVSPIRFIEIGPERAASDVAAALKKLGYFVNVSVYPAVPRQRAGLRIMLTCHHELDDVQNLAHEVSKLVRRYKS